MGASEYFSNVQLGLWYGILKATSSRPERTFYYGWCEVDNPAYDDTNCFSLVLVRLGACLGICLMLAGLVMIALLSTYVIKLRIEPTMARVAAVFSGTLGAGRVSCGLKRNLLAATHLRGLAQHRAAHLISDTRTTMQ